MELIYEYTASKQAYTMSNHKPITARLKIKLPAPLTARKKVTLRHLLSLKYKTTEN